MFVKLKDLVQNMKSFQYSISFVIATIVWTLFITSPHADSEKFSTDEIVSVLKESLQGHLQVSGDFDILLQTQKLIIPKHSNESKLKVSDIKVADNQQSFEAQLELIDTQPSKTLPLVKGRIQFLIEIPVLTKALLPGDEVTEADITWQKIPSSRLSQTILTKQEELIGKTPSSRVLQPGQPLYRSDLKTPIVIKKGDLITVTYRTEGLFLSSQAIALQDATKGTSFRLQTGGQNKKEIFAKAIGPGEAEIHPRI